MARAFAILCTLGLFCWRVRALRDSEVPVLKGINKEKVAGHVVKDLEQRILRRQENTPAKHDERSAMRFLRTALGQSELQAGGDFPMSGDIGIQMAGHILGPSSTASPPAAEGAVEEDNQENPNAGLVQALNNINSVSPNPTTNPATSGTSAASSLRMSSNSQERGEQTQHVQEQEHTAAEQLARDQKAAEDKPQPWSLKGWLDEAPPTEAKTSARFSGLRSGTNAADDQWSIDDLDSGAAETPLRFARLRPGMKEADDEWTVDAMQTLKNNVQKKEELVEITKEQAEAQQLQLEEQDASLDTQIASTKEQIRIMIQDSDALKTQMSAVTAKDVNQRAALDKLKSQFT